VAFAPEPYYTHDDSSAWPYSEPGKNWILMQRTYPHQPEWVLSEPVAGFYSPGVE